MKSFSAFGRRLTVMASALLVSLSSMAQLTIATPDGDLKMKFIGRTNLDLGTYLGADDNRSNRNGAYVNDTRLGIIADYSGWQTKIELSFATKNIAFRDAYIKRIFDDKNSLTFGNFFIPFGMKQAGLAYKFIESAPADLAFTPWRKMGMQYNYTGEKVNFSLGFFSDATIDDSKPLNQGYKATAHVLFRPIDANGTIFHVALSPIFTHPMNNLKFSGVVPTTINSNSAVATPSMDVYNYGLLEFQALYILRRFYVEAHLLEVFVNRPNSYVSDANVEVSQDNLNAMGVHVQTSWLILGEQQNYNRKTGLAANPAAKSLEVLLRYSHTGLDDYGKLNDLTLGMNYYFNKYVRVKVNYSHSMVKDGAKIDQLQGRLQFSF